MKVRPRPLLALVRPFTLLAPVVGVACAAGVASSALGRPLPALELLLACIAAAAATGASNAWNQVFDLPLDRIDKPDRPLPAGAMSPRTALWVADVLALVTLLVAVFVSSAFLGCVSAGLLASWIYSAPPLRLRKRTFGALLAIALPRGLLVPVAGWAVVAFPDRADPWALGAVAGFFILGAAATKDFDDVKGDAAHGVRTLPAIMGVRRAAWVVTPFLVLPFALYAVFGTLGWLDVPQYRLNLLTLFLAIGGVLVAVLLHTDTSRIETAGVKTCVAWRGMYLLLLASQVGALLAYAL